MNGNSVGQGIKNEAQAAQFMSTVTFSGLTPLGTVRPAPPVEPFRTSP